MATWPEETAHVRLQATDTCSHLVCILGHLQCAVYKTSLNIVQEHHGRRGVSDSLKGTNCAREKQREHFSAYRDVCDKPDAVINHSSIVRAA